MLFIRAVIVGPPAAALLVLAGMSPAAAARAPVRSPSCAPATLNNSSLNGGSLAISPVAGSRDAPARAQISFLGVSAGSISAVSVVGARSGRHAGRLAPYSQRDGASFVPARPFAEGERVTVHARVHERGRVRMVSDSFDVAREDPLSATGETLHPGSAREAMSFASRPDLHPPMLTVTANSPATAAGEIFVAPYTGPGQAGPEILDHDGRPLWLHPLPPHVFAANLRVQSLRGQPVLTWWRGNITVHGFGIGEDIVQDRSYRTVAIARAGNGLSADLHDFVLAPDASALLTAYHSIRCDLSPIGGPANGALTDGVIQDVDLVTGLVRSEWTSVEHVALSESYEHVRRASTSTPFDFFHVNSIDLEPGGQILISARNTWAVYALEAAGGRVVWRLGGKHSTFAEGPAGRTAYQHDPRLLSPDEISIFDNGASPRVRAQSRAIVLSLNAARRTASVVRELRHAPPLLSESQGNAQALDNGDWFVGWGQAPALSEYGPDGSLLFDAHFPAHEQSYRSLRFTWSATPVHPPVLALRGTAAAAVLYASWNGATELAAWRALAGPAPDALEPVAQAPRSGFETALALPPLRAGSYVAAQALAADGSVLAVSAAARVPGS